MSDEASITASSLLSSLLGATSANALPSQPLAEQNGLLGEKNSVSSAFNQLLSANLDAEGSARGPDGIYPLPVPLVAPPIQSGELAVMSNDLKQHLRQFPANTEPSTLENSGSTLPVDGSSLPIDDSIPPSTDDSDALQLLENAPLLTEAQLAGAQQHISNPTEKIDSQPGSLTNYAGDQADNLSDDLLATSDAVEQLVAVAPSSPSTVTANSIADLNNARSRDLSASDSSSGFADNRLEPTSDNSFTEDMGFDQQSSRNAQENPLDLRRSQGPTAEFALDTPRRDDFKTHLSATPTGELASTSLPAPQQLTSTGAALASTPLTLVADRQLAGQQIAQQIASFVQQGEDAVEINLSPPHLGKISARIMLQNDQASVVLTAPSADIRELIEASLPKLGSLLEEAGLSLADANVSSQGQGGPADDEAKDQTGGTQHSDTHSAATETTIAAPSQQLRGLLDAYA